MTSTLSPETAKSLRRTAALIREDMEADVARYDGQIATGKAIAEMHGELAAAISSLAGMLAALATALESS
jgi:vacuolar-type H+-ATPase catalytic subunit A/Vma1